MCQSRILQIFKMILLVGMLLMSGISVYAQNSKCEKLSSLATLEDHNTIVETSLKMLTGTWVSESCETRPGPEYVLRSYTFESDGSYYLVQHRYYDDSCSSPQLSVFSYGRIQLRTSLMQPGAASGIMRVTNITVMPQDNNAAREMDRVVALECPGQDWKTWRRYEEHVVYDSAYDEKKKTYNLWESRFVQMNNHHDVNRRANLHHSFGDISCLGTLKWAFNELKLLKIQLRPIMEKLKPRKYPRHMRAELLLGDIHTNYKQRENHIPTSFQVPLIKQAKGETISVNRHSYIIKSGTGIPSNIFINSKTPAHLIEKPHLPPYIWGEWTSTRCEIRPLGLYLTRRFSFYAEDSTWIGEHKFYSDPFCKIPKFIVTAAGHFTLKGPNKELKGTTNIDFQIEKASLTVLDQRMIYDLRLPGVCGVDEWEVNVPKELSSTNGCVQLGIILPSIQYDIVKLEMDYRGSCLLFLGQVNTDSMPNKLSERPTSFQLPLVKCGEVASYSQSLREILNDGFYYSSSANIKFNHLFVFVIVFYLYR